MASPLHRVKLFLSGIARTATCSRFASSHSKIGRLAPILFLAVGLKMDLRAADSVIISEFMAANARTLTSDQRAFDDWIELRNTGSNVVNLEGWSLTDNAKKPRQWIFPETRLSAGGHLLVWASGQDRRLSGAPLHTNFKLSVAGEFLALVRPDGSVASDFAPTYPPQSTDVSYGFFSGATQAVFFLAPTPGKANETSTNPPGPVITTVTHAPEFPQSNEAVTVTARVSPLLGPVTNVTLWWRALFHRETNVGMSDAGNGAWTATLPAGKAGEGQILRWRVTAQDASGRESRLPLFGNSQFSSRYFGTVVNPRYVTSALPVFQLFIAPQQLGGAESESGARGCFFHDGEFYDNVLVKVRGNSTAGFPKKSHRLEFPHDHPLRHPGPGGRVRHTSLMAEYGDPTYLRQHLSFWLEGETGSAAPFHDPVRVQLNGEFWQLAMHSEVLGEELLARHGLDPDGALYKAVGTLTPDFNSTGNFEKKNRRQEGEDDYVALAKALHESRGPNARRTSFFDMMNVPAVVNYLAVARLTQEDDDIWANMSLYRDSEGSGEWRPIPFDMNVSWGFSFQRGGINPTDDDFRSHPFFGAAHVGANQGFNRLYDVVVRLPETREMLLRRMRTILDRWWQPPGMPPPQRVIEQHIASLTNRMRPEANLDREKWGGRRSSARNASAEDSLAVGVRELIEKFIEPRRRHFYVTHSITNTTRAIGITSRNNAGIPEPQPTDAKVGIHAFGVCPTNTAQEYLCLTNANAFAVDLSDWRLDGAVKFKFAGGTVLPGRGSLYVAPDVKAFRARASAPPGRHGLFVVGNYRGRLGDGGRVVLKDDRDGMAAEGETGGR
jgi:spore coat protein CotH